MSASVPPPYTLPVPGRRISYSQLRQHHPPPPSGAPRLRTSSVLLSALAFTTAKTWVFHDEVASGGVGWLALCYWGGRIGEEVRDRWRGRKGKRREGDGIDNETEAALITGAMLRLAALLHAVRAIGPLRAAIFLEASSLLASSVTSASYTSAALAGLCSVAVVASSPHAYLVLLGLFLTIVCRLEVILSLASRRLARPRGNPVSIGLMIAAAALSTLPAYLSSSQPFLPSLSASPAQLAASLLAGALTLRLPIPRVLPTGLVTPHLPCTLRDRLALVLSIGAVQAFALPPAPGGTDVLLIPLFCLAAYAVPDPAAAGWTFPVASTSRWSPMNIVPPAWRPHLLTILRTPASSRIFYFLMLNLAYFGVQMAYGIWTNSLGLISDAIHMLFDCLGLGVGLWASVAATWKPDGRYTFGYSRVETLSGFANGLFLILISIFIIFEGIQRIVNPPEMETQQLLLVSSVGLGINLFGMWATGGHHHHGHSHGHDHGHGHSHAHPHVAVHEKKVDHRTNGYESEAVTSIYESPRLTRERRRSSQLNLAMHGLASEEHRLAPTGTIFDVLLDSANHNMRGVFLHVLADTLGSVGVIVSTLLIRLTGLTVWDPIASLFIAALILASVLPLVLDSARVLALDNGDAAPDVRAALAELKTIDGLASFSAPRFWPRCEGEYVGSIHVQLAPAPANWDPTKSPAPYAAAGLLAAANGHSHAHTHAHASGQTIYANADKVVARVERVLKRRIHGLKELVVQVEGSEERRFCGCMTGAGR
ncbi:putative zinc transporter msc2 [Cryptotrichosporon argae]